MLCRAYPPTMTIRSLLRKIKRALTPPGNRGSLDTSYRQPGGEGTHTTSEVGAAETAHGFDGY
jgi:hypothetical protein